MRSWIGEETDLPCGWAGAPRGILGLRGGGPGGGGGMLPRFCESPRIAPGGMDPRFCESPRMAPGDIGPRGTELSRGGGPGGGGGIRECESARIDPAGAC